VRKLLVTGASGYLGGVVAARAAVSAWEVVGTAFSAAGTGWRVVDVRDRGALDALVRAVGPDAVVHTAYRQRGPAAREVNAAGAENVARAARAVGARLVHVSSDAIFAGDGDRPLVEEDAAAPVTAYGATKAEAEVLVAAAHPGAVIVRTSLLYGGPGRPASPHEELALAVARGEQHVRFYNDEVRSPVQVDDLAEALLELAALDRAGPLHVGGADGLSRLAFARLIVSARSRLDPDALAGEPAPPDRPRFCPLDSARAVALLKVRLRGARDVLGGG
jgi:dTDP-4-dehydrorhamnose reductase